MPSIFNQLISITLQNITVRLEGACKKIISKNNKMNDLQYLLVK